MAYCKNCTKTRQHWTFTCCELQLARQLDSRVDIRYVSLTEVGHSVLCFLHSHCMHGTVLRALYGCKVRPLTHLLSMHVVQIIILEASSNQVEQGGEGSEPPCL